MISIVKGLHLEIVLVLLSLYPIKINYHSQRNFGEKSFLATRRIFGRMVMLTSTILIWNDLLKTTLVRRPLTASSTGRWQSISSFPKLDDMEVDEMWVQQDGSTCRTANATIRGYGDVSLWWRPDLCGRVTENKTTRIRATISPLPIFELFYILYYYNGIHEPFT